MIRNSVQPGAHHLAELPPPMSDALMLLSAWVEDKVRLHTLPGVGIGIVHGGRLCWTGTFGAPAPAGPQTPFTDRTPFRIASISKVFTATALMKLREAGALDLHRPLSSYLPWFPERPGRPGDEPLTVWHLLTHTAALPRESGHSYWTDNEFPTREQLRTAAAAIPPVFPPGQQFKYSNFGLALAGEIVEAVTDRSYEQYLTEEIFQPLELSDTRVTHPGAIADSIFPGYALRDAKTGTRSRLPYTDCRAISPAASLSSTVADLAKLIAFHLDRSNDSLLSPASKELMQRAHWVNPDWLSGRGLGFALRRVGTDTLIGHQGWLPGHRSELSFIPGLDFGIVAFVATNDLNPSYFVEQALHILRPAVVSLNGAAAAVDRAAAAPYLGRYRNAWGETAIAIRDGQLLMLNLADPDPILTALTLTAEGVDRFRLSSPYGGWQIGELALFERDAAGRVQSLRLGDTYTYPV